MLGLTFEKLLAVALVAGAVIGPQRLPVYARQLGEVFAALRRLIDSARREAEREMGTTLRTDAWEAMDLRQFHPRRIVQDAFAQPGTPTPPASTATEEIVEQASRVRPGQKYLVLGDAAHPRRVAIDSLPTDDPRRLAARLPCEELSLDERAQAEAD